MNFHSFANWCLSLHLLWMTGKAVGQDKLFLLGGFVTLWARASLVGTTQTRNTRWSLPESWQLDSDLPKTRMNFSFTRWGSLLLPKCHLYKNLWQWRTPGCFHMASQSTYVFFFLDVLSNTLLTSHFSFIFFTKQNHPTTLWCRIMTAAMALQTHLPQCLLCPSALSCHEIAITCRKQISCTAPG